MEAKRKIMIVDDEPDLLKVIQNRLESWGFEVSTWNKGTGTIEKIKEIKPDLVILDIMLPDANGCDICYKIKTDPEISSIPVILATAKPDWKAEMYDVGKFAKGDDCIPKPFEADLLLEKINNLLKK